MGTRLPLLEVDPRSLPPGARMGSWRIKGWRGRGTYGTVYRAERAGREWAGSVALKLANHPRDERFAREAELHSRIRSPHVPRLHDHGLWEHPSGAFPFLVMDWVEGVELYEWAARRNPTERQVLGLLAQMMRALEATHAVGGVHRDVKGGNVLVRLSDGWAFLTDFGAGYYRGAATLTSKLLPPGTPAYRSPEAWAFLRAFRRHPTVHYPASTCDDLFALGVMAYRLMTDEYPPSTDPEEPRAKVWCEGGPGAPPVRGLNPRVSPETESVVSRLLAIAPVDRFQGKAHEAAEALEEAARRVGPEADTPLFEWGHEHRPRWRSPGGVRLAEKRDAAAREELARREEEARARGDAADRQPPLRPRVNVWGVEGVVAAAGLLFVSFVVALLYRGPQRGQSSAQRDAREGGVVAVGDSDSAASKQASAPSDGAGRTLGSPMPEKPLPGQRKPPCNRTGEVAIRGGCWYALRDARPPCKEEGKEDAYAWEGACYGPSFPVQRPPTSSPPY
ncbi:MAG: serine/threonine protein kinase [Myxococcaceae bacterium]|nr:serine/threonine protein kinase [Myxococcaceae bacterium]